MGRLFLILAALGVVAMLAVIVTTSLRDAARAGRAGLRTYGGFGEDGLMAPTGIQKAAYVALIVLLFGVTTGWLGGL